MTWLGTWATVASMIRLCELHSESWGVLGGGCLALWPGFKHLFTCLPLLPSHQASQPSWDHSVTWTSSQFWESSGLHGEGLCVLRWGRGGSSVRVCSRAGQSIPLVSLVPFPSMLSWRQLMTASGPTDPLFHLGNSGEGRSSRKLPTSLNLVWGAWAFRLQAAISYIHKLRPNHLLSPQGFPTIFTLEPRDFPIFSLFFLFFF